MSFASFIISLAQSALVHLGQSPDPATGHRAVDLPVARDTIDTLGMLAAKTTGNLDADEQQLLDSLLDELRAKFVEVSRASG